MVYEGPLDSEGNVDQSKLKPIHMATSNGNGLYSSKNGTAASPKDDATWDEAIKPYTDGVEEGKGTVVKCFKEKEG